MSWRNNRCCSTDYATSIEPIEIHKTVSRVITRDDWTRIAISANYRNIAHLRNLMFLQFVVIDASYFNDQ